jgi:hypothetical protein
VSGEAGFGAEELWRSLGRFMRWLEAAGGVSYDSYDIWGTKFGIWGRRLYYSSRPAGTPFVAPILLMEILLPQWRAWFVNKNRFATADAQAGLGWLNLYEITRDKEYLEKAAALGRELLASSIPGYHGRCWGYPFDWQQTQGFWKKNSPLITSTPYCFELFAKLADITGDAAHLETCRSIAQFIHKDLCDTPASATAAAGGYLPGDRSRVLNASAYRAMVLFEAAARFGVEEYAATARGNLNFVLENQRGDGAWLYSLDEGERFIDHFHTCFVLKNLWKTNRRLKSREISAAIVKGFAFYRRELFDAEGLPKPFVIRPRAPVVRLEMYDFAESIGLGAMLAREIPGAMEMAGNLARALCRDYQLADGHFVTRVYLGGIRHKLGYLRWPQAAIFCALTGYLLELNSSQSHTEKNHD